jgi:hypothetical protein
MSSIDIFETDSSDLNVNFTNVSDANLTSTLRAYFRDQLHMTVPHHWAFSGLKDTPNGDVYALRSIGANREKEVLIKSGLSRKESMLFCISLMRKSSNVKAKTRNSKGFQKPKR